MENLSLRIVLNALRNSLSISYLGCSDEELVSYIVDPIVVKYKINNRNGDPLHLSRQWVSKCLHDVSGFATHLQLKKASEKYPEAIKELLYYEFVDGKLKLKFDLGKLANEKKKIVKIVEQDTNLYPSQIKSLNSIDNVYEYFAKIIQLSFTIRKPGQSIDGEMKENIYEILDLVINFIIKAKISPVSGVKHTLAYEIADKCERNCINGKFRNKIIESFENYYFDLDDFLENSIDLDYALYDRITKFYVDAYNEVLDNEEIDYRDENDILDNSILIFQSLNEKIQNTLFNNNILTTSYEDSKEYIMALSTYVFYKCKFLLPVEEKTK